MAPSSTENVSGCSEAFQPVRSLPLKSEVKPSSAANKGAAASKIRQQVFLIGGSFGGSSRAPFEGVVDGRLRGFEFGRRFVAQIAKLFDSGGAVVLCIHRHPASPIEEADYSRPFRRAFGAGGVL